MKIRKRFTPILLAGLLAAFPVVAQEDAEVTALPEVAEALDLQAVSELFKESEDLESFEKALNDPDVGINNLDLDENGEVDYIRVLEEVAEETHVIILQVPLSEEDFQDIATIEIEKTGEEDYNLQVHGNEDIYGTDYYVAPAAVHVHTWPIMVRIYEPGYRPYRSVYHYRHYPRLWKPYKPVKTHVYRIRTARYRTRNGFVVTRTGRVRTVSRVNYRPRSSTVVVKRTRVVKTPHGRKVVRKPVVKKRR